MTTKKTRTKKTTKRGHSSLTAGQLVKLGSSIGRRLVPEIVRMAEGRGVSFPLDFHNLDFIKKMAALALEKTKKIRRWDDLSWDHQDSFFEGWSQIMRESGIIS